VEIEKLSDLDALVLRCRGAAARSYIAEAVGCYKAGSFRASIVATWTAVVYDFLDKLRELELAGDAKAKRLLEKFEGARQSSNWKASLEFERDLLETARTEFELISPVEATDLERLEADRNRCAHPSMSSSHEPYRATAELSRTHIKNAVIYFLEHPPVQGKAAFDRLATDIQSEYFPSETKQAVDVFRSGPLARARLPLVRGLLIALSKELLQKGWNDRDRARRFAALTAIVEMYRAEGEKVLGEILPDLMLRVPDEKYYRVIFYMANVKMSWDLAGEAARIKAREYIENGDEEGEKRFLHHSVRIPALRERAKERMAGAVLETFAKVLRVDPSPDYVDIALKRFELANGFREAERIFQVLILSLANVLKIPDLERIVAAFVSNRQITFAMGIPSLLHQLWTATNASATEAKPTWKKLYERLTEQAEEIPEGQALRTVLQQYYSF
jgi:hypothetical protein